MKNISKTHIAIFLATVISLVVLFPKLLNIAGFQSVETSRYYYKTARTYQKNNECKEAFYSFAKISPNYAAYDAVLFYQAKCAAELQDEKTAILKFKKLLAKYPGSPLAPQASYNLAQAYVRTKLYKQAEEQFFKTIKKFPESDFTIGSYYYIGELNLKKDKRLSKKYWLKYLEKSPSGRFASECITGLQDPAFSLFSFEKKNLMIALFFQEDYKGVLKYAKQLPLKESWYYTAKSYEALGDKAHALYFYKEGLKSSSIANEKKENFEQGMVSYVALSNLPEDKAWDDVLSFTSSARDFALYRKAGFVPKNKAITYYWKILKIAPRGAYASDALWYIFWDAYLNKKDNYKLALNLAEIHISSYENTKASPAIYFWMGKIYEKLGKKSKAFNLYEEVSSKYPDSYYAFRANGRMTALKTGFDPAWSINLRNRLPENLPAVKNPFSDSEIISKYGKQTVELLNVQDYDTILLFLKKDPFLESWISLQNEAVSKSIVLARNEIQRMQDKPNLHSETWKLLYPVYYPELINHNSIINRLDPLMVIALIKEESHFNPYALSYSNARGLMQLLPATAKDISKWKKLGAYTDVQLFEPEINIKLGTAYLSHVKNELYGNMMFAVASYNGGPSAVKKWASLSQNSDLDEFVENIPYKQTNNYVKKVFQSYWNYKRIYRLK